MMIMIAMIYSMFRMIIIIITIICIIAHPPKGLESARTAAMALDKNCSSNGTRNRIIAATVLETQ